MTKIRIFSLPAAMFLTSLAPVAAMANGVIAVNTFGARNGFPTGALVPFGGLLYGTSEEGAGSESGTVFSVDPKTGMEHNLYVFSLQTNNNPKDGFVPDSGLTRLGSKLYGATQEGNGTQTENQNYLGFGTVFVFDPATNKETPLHDFSGGDGAQPSLWHDPLVAYKNALYGTAFFNGPNNRGEIYRITPAGQFSIIYGFPDIANGCNPTGIVIVADTLYGTTLGCGKNGGGNVYTLNLTTGVQKVLHSFDAGSTPLGRLLPQGNALFGVTRSAGLDHAGTAYKIDLTSGAYTLLHTFTAAGDDGDQPAAGLTLFNGKIYGVTTFGPGQGIVGTIFAIDPATGTEATVANFTQASGYAPFGPLLSYGRALYGTTVDYLSESGLQQGSVFKFKP